VLKVPSELVHPYRTAGQGSPARRFSLRAVILKAKGAIPDHRALPLAGEEKISSVRNHARSHWTSQARLRPGVGSGAGIWTN